jgi:hypothetical protein
MKGDHRHMCYDDEAATGTARVRLRSPLPGIARLEQSPVARAAAEQSRPSRREWLQARRLRHKWCLPISSGAARQLGERV